MSELEHRAKLSRALDDGVRAVLIWWDVGILTMTLTRDDAARLIGISIGLGDLFDDDQAAEQEWMNTPRQELDRISPWEHIRHGRSIRDVVDMVDRARGLR